MVRQVHDTGPRPFPATTTTAAEPLDADEISRAAERRLPVRHARQHLIDKAVMGLLDGGDRHPVLDRNRCRAWRTATLQPGQPHQHPSRSPFEKEVSGVFHATNQQGGRSCVGRRAATTRGGQAPGIAAVALIIGAALIAAKIGPHRGQDRPRRPGGDPHSPR